MKTLHFLNLYALISLASCKYEGNTCHLTGKLINALKEESGLQDSGPLSDL